MKKIYYKLHLKLLSPLAVGSGSGDAVDSTVAVDAFHKPYIPASTLAGLFRSMTEENVRRKLFGDIENDTVQSLIYTYDAVISENADTNITVRDSVALDENKISKKGAKFDFEVVETGTEFITYLELHDTDNYEKTVDALLDAAQKFSIGAKTTRGYGKIEITSAYKIAFDMADRGAVEKWLDFDLFEAFDDEKSHKLCLGSGKNDKINISVSLNLVGAITIRKYSTDYLTDENGKPQKDKKGKAIGDADFKHLTLKDNTPVIPGTSWAGAFRHHMQKIAPEIGIKGSFEEIIKMLFGYVDPKTKASQKSKIYFNESQITKATEKVISRTAIDRFTGGSADTALFTERVFYGGETELDIEIIKSDDRPDYLKPAMQLLFFALADLHNGLLAIGGQTSVGSGLFEVKGLSINGNDYSEKFMNYNFDSCIEGAL